MGDFIRCYIGDIALATLKNVQRESNKFDEWELFQGRTFDRGQINESGDGFDPEELLLKGLAKHCVIAETRQPENVKPSLIWNNALNIADVLTLLSIARGRYLSPLLTEKHIGSHISISKGIITTGIDGNWDIVSLNKFGNFVSEALNFIENDVSWLTTSGFTPSIYWYTQAQVSYLLGPSVLEIGLNWVSIEVLATVYLTSRRIVLRNKKERVKRFIIDRGYTSPEWDFLNELIDDWYAIRNSLYHEGSQAFTIPVLSRRRQQIRDFISLVLVEMLQPQDAARKSDIVRRIMGY